MFINKILKGRIKQVHLVGIGGIGMSGIARVLMAEGFLVSGSDLYENNEINILKNLGARIFIGHRAENINNADVLVYSSAINLDNIEILEAKKANIPVIQRAVMLAELMRLRCGIAISGAHGKTTTTSMIGYLMYKANLDPTVVIGGVVNKFDSNAIVGKSQFMIAEADESDGSFLHLSPSIAVITNIDREHLDYYQGGIEEVLEKFRLFLKLVPFYGLIVACIDDENIKKILANINRRVITYGFDISANYSARNLIYEGFSTSFDLYINQEFIRTITISMAGKHNVLNALAAIIVLEEVGIKTLNLLESLKSFDGVKRRFSLVSSNNNFTIIDDYAHHPTEIKAILQTAKNCFLNRKIHVLFQPHRFSRTRDLLDDFANCFADCDSLIISDIYAASEEPIFGINSQMLAKNVTKFSNKNAMYGASLDESIQKMADLVQKNDVILTLGAGNVTSAGSKINYLLSSKF